MFRSRWPEGLNIVFLVTTIATSVTGFLFHSSGFGPPHVLGVISLLVPAAALVVLYGSHLCGLWRPTYIARAVTALYLNVFAGAVQAFRKPPFAHTLAPTRSEPSCIVTQVIVLVVFAVFGFPIIRRFHPPAKLMARYRSPLPSTLAPNVSPYPRRGGGGS
jgi:hypothetical protein